MTDYPVFTIDKDEDAQMRAIRFTKDLYERIIEAENLALMNEIKANTVVINGRKYGMLKDKPGFVPTIIGMKAETKVNMPDEWDFFLQERPPQPKTNYDRVISKTPEELAEFLSNIRGGCRALTTGSYVCDFYTDELDTNCKACWLDWLKQEAEGGNLK